MPTSVGTTHVPLGRGPRPCKNSADGSATSCSPRSSIENTQISSIPPKRFLYARTMRYSPD